MNPISGNLPAALDQALADIAQATSAYDYNNIITLGQAWPALDGDIKAGIRRLADECLEAGDEEESMDLAVRLSEAMERAQKAARKAREESMDPPDFRPGELVLYRNGSTFQLGLVKKIVPDGAFVYYSEGDTASKTPFGNLEKIANGYAVRTVTLGGKATTLKNGIAVLGGLV